MIRKPRPVRSVIALPVLAILMATSVGVPLLDSGRDPSRLAVAGPDAPTGFFEHDHELCIQHGATAWAPAPAVAPPLDDARGHAALAAEAAAAPLAAPRLTHQSRAPPVV